jgi:hypothetical protein
LPLTTGVTGTLPVANGGTGLTTLTANNVILGNGTSTPSFVAPSTTGNVLTSNGTTWVSSPAGGGGGGGPLVFLSTTTTSTSVSGVTFTGLSSSTYIAFMVEFQGVRPVSDLGQLRMQIGDNTDLFLDSYDSTVIRSGSGGGSLTNTAASSVSYFNLTTANVRSSTAGGCQGIIWVHQSDNATPSFTSDVSWWAPPDGQALQTRAGGAMQSAYSGFTVNQIKIFYSNGNITSNSKITIYGLKAS